MASGRTEAKRDLRPVRMLGKKQNKRPTRRQKAEEADKPKPANPSDVRVDVVEQRKQLTRLTLCLNNRTSEQGVEEGLSGEYEMLKGKGQAFAQMLTVMKWERQAGHRLDGNPIITGRQDLLTLR